MCDPVVALGFLLRPLKPAVVVGELVQVGQRNLPCDERVVHR
jgi:hypothetical protein